MKKVAVIGHLDWKNNDMIGAVVKARNIYGQLLNQFEKDQINNVDIYNWRRRKIAVLISVFLSFAKHKNIVLVCSDTSNIMMKMFSILKKVFKNKIHYCVVGGDIADLLQSNPEQVKSLKVIDNFYVETSDCLEGLINLNIKNVFLLRNFKQLEPLTEEQLSDNSTEPFKFCTFSRVIEQKGITDAINAISKINEVYGKEICLLDIYGPIDDSYKEKFNRLIKNNISCNYQGIIESNKSVEILKGYYCLLFPTKFQTEGIPGTLIDGFAAGVPVISADWIRCRQLITDGVNGVVYPFGDVQELIEKMKQAINDPEYIYKLRLESLRTFELYRPEIAILPLLNNLTL